MWCCAPAWPAHARHVAVEFVHPVIMGKRALPTVAVAEPELAAALRPSVRAGDLLLAVATAGEPRVVDAMLRAGAWGLETVWIGAGPRPPAGAADHVLWIDDDDPLVPYSGRMVLLYHVLWELTHVCFEHAGLLTPDAEECADDVCITCSDEGRLVEVIAAAGDLGTEVRSPDGTESVDTTLIGPVEPGDLLLVHAGTALTRVGDDR